MTKNKNKWITPAGEYSTFYSELLQEAHLLIAGATGSGKSVCINGIMHAALFDSPNEKLFILIDPKRVELAAYKDIPHTLAHAAGFNPQAWEAALEYAVKIMDIRYDEMERKRIKKYAGADLYIIIDEWAAVYKNGGRNCYKYVLRLISEGRAAGVHVIMATQIPKANIIPTEIRENFAARLCLRTNNRQQSRVIMDCAGCEDLPLFGYGYLDLPQSNDLYKLPMIEEAELDRVVNFWNEQKPRGILRRIFRR